MAIVKDNDIIEGLSGRFGKRMVFKVIRGKTIVARAPRKPTKQSPLQKQNRTRFREATIYAQAMMLNPEKKSYYKEKAKELNLPNAYTAAITDFMRKPIISNHEINPTENTNHLNITCIAEKKGFKVHQVRVVIQQSQQIIEDGQATQIQNTDQWTYLSTTTPYHQNTPITIKLLALDNYGNTCVLIT